MSGKITPQSQARMERRDEFVPLIRVNNIDVMLKGDPLPIMSITISGLPRERETAERMLRALDAELHEMAYYAEPYAPCQRGVLSIKRRMAA